MKKDRISNNRFYNRIFKKLKMLFKKERKIPFHRLGKYPVLRELWFVLIFLLDIFIILMEVLSMVAAGFLFCVIFLFLFNITESVPIGTYIIERECIDKYITWFGVFSSVSLIPLLALVFSEYHAAKVSQDEIEHDLSNGIKSFSIREIPMGAVADDYRSLFHAMYNQYIFEEQYIPNIFNKKLKMQDKFNNKLQKINNKISQCKKESKRLTKRKRRIKEKINCLHYIDDYKLRDYKYVFEIEFKSNISDLFQLNLLYAYLRVIDFNMGLKKDISIHNYESKNDLSLSQACVCDGNKKEKIIIFVGMPNGDSDKNTQKNKQEEYNILNNIEALMRDANKNVVAYQKQFVLLINFSQRKGKRTIFRYRLFPILRTIYNAFYNRMANRRAMRLELEIGEKKSDSIYSNKYQHYFVIKNISFTLVKNIGKWSKYVKTARKSQAKYIDIERSDNIDKKEGE